jgi:hypothetical protein
MTTIKINSIIQLYLLANSASTRLQTEIHRSDICLCRMVGHANMLDRLTAEINARENALYVADVPVRVRAKAGINPRSKATAA